LFRLITYLEQGYKEKVLILTTLRALFPPYCPFKKYSYICGIYYLGWEDFYCSYSLFFTSGFPPGLRWITIIVWVSWRRWACSILTLAPVAVRRARPISAALPRRNMLSYPSIRMWRIRSCNCPLLSL